MSFFSVPLHSGAKCKTRGINKKKIIFPKTNLMPPNNVGEYPGYKKIT
jgi:hypothetical protein